MALAGKSLAFVVFIAVLGFFLYAIRPVMQAWLLETTPKNMGGTSIGVLFGAQSLGSSVGTAARRGGRGPLRAHRNVLLPRRDDRPRESFHLLHAEDGSSKALKPRVHRGSRARIKHRVLA